MSATIRLGSRQVFLPIVMRFWTPPKFVVTKEASAAEVVKLDPVVYTVTAEDGATQKVYTVTVTVAPALAMTTASALNPIRRGSPMTTAW